MRKILLTILCLCLTIGNPQIINAATGLTVWDEFAESMEKNSKLPSSFGEVADWAKDRFVDAEGWVSGILNSTSRKGYRYNNRPSEPVINAVINGKWGNELSYVKVESTNDEKKHASSIKLRAGGTYKATIYYINDCRKAISAKDVELYIGLPSSVKKKQPVELLAVIASSNTTPEMIYDSVKLKANEDLKISYVNGSMKIYNGGKANGEKLPAEQAFDIGRRIRLGYNSLNGELPAGRKYAGKVTFKFKATRK